MAQPVEWVIRVLDDSHRKSINYENRRWLMKNVEKLDVRVCVEDCVSDTFRIAKHWNEKDSILIQEGKRICFQDDFHPGKEALSLVKYNDGYLVFLYSPKEL